MKFLDNARRAHRGELSLGVTYWLWLWLPQVVIGLMLLLLEFNVLELETLDPNFLFYSATLYGLEVLSLAWLIYCGIGVFRSANHAKSRFWAVVARIVVGLGFLAALKIPLSWLDVPDADSRNQISQAMSILNAQLPKKLDPITVLRAIHYENAKLTYAYDLTLSPTQVMHWAVLQNNFTSGNCSSWKTYLGSEALTEIDAEYYSNGTLLKRIQIQKTNCP